jgi:hypothetical protein
MCRRALGSDSRRCVEPREASRFALLGLQESSCRAASCDSLFSDVTKADTTGLLRQCGLSATISFCGDVDEHLIIRVVLMAVSGLNIYPEIGYPEVLRDFSQFLQANARIVPLN